MNKPLTKTETFFQQEATDVQLADFCGGVIAGCSYKSPDKETANEDAAAWIELSKNHGVLVVADGVGGQSAGDRAARTAIESVVEHCQDATDETSLRAEILDAIEAANREVLSWGIGAGSTIVVAEYLLGTVRVVHVGDSTALLTSNHGTIKFLSVAHGPVAMAVEIGMLDESEAIEHEDRNIITNCIGSTEMKIEVGPEVLMAARDTLLLASDGLFDNLTSTQVTNSIRAGHMESQLNTMIEKTRGLMTGDSETGKPDDLTVLCFRQK